MGGSIPPRSMDDRAKQLKVYRYWFLVECMNPEQKILSRQLEDILKIAHKIERLTRDTHVSKDDQSRH